MVEVTGLTCPACGIGGLTGGLVDLHVDVELDGIIRFGASGLMRHRCAPEGDGG